MGSGVRQGLNYDEVKELRVIMPSSSTEQSAIAAYLDDQCAKIDTLISEAKTSSGKPLLSMKQSLKDLTQTWK